MTFNRGIFSLCPSQPIQQSNWPFVPSIFGIGWLVGWMPGWLVDVFILDCLKEELRAIIFFYFTSLNRSVLPPISLNMSECVTEYWTGRSFAGQSETCKSSELKQQWTEQRKDWQTDCPTYLRSNYPAPSEQYLLHQIRKTTIAKLMQDICNDRLCKLYLVGR